MKTLELVGHGFMLLVISSCGAKRKKGVKGKNMYQLMR